MWDEFAYENIKLLNEKISNSKTLSSILQEASSDIVMYPSPLTKFYKLTSIAIWMILLKKSWILWRVTSTIILAANKESSAGQQKLH